MSSGLATDEVDVESAYRQVQRGFWLLAQPVDFEALERDGVLVGVGDWYRIERPDDLPKSLWFGASTRVVDGQTLLKFSVETERYQVLARRVGVDWRAPQPD